MEVWRSTEIAEISRLCAERALTIRRMAFPGPRVARYTAGGAGMKAAYGGKPALHGIEGCV
jgi:hypothetical protein